MKKTYMAPRAEQVEFPTTDLKLLSGSLLVSDEEIGGEDIQAIRWAGDIEDMEELEEWMDEYDEV
jgi:hypothetical protein